MSWNQVEMLANLMWRRPSRARQIVIIPAILLALITATKLQAQDWVLSSIYSNSAGEVGQIAMTTLKTGWVVTAVSTSTNNLEVISWNDTGTALARTGSATGDVIFPLFGLAITTLDSGRVVTAAVSPATGDMELAVWKISSTGTVSKQSSVLGGVVSEVSVATLDSGRVVTAMQNSSGDLKVRVWKISSTGAFTTEGAYTAGAASQIAIVGVNASQVVTAFRNGSEDLELIAWSIDGSGNVTRQGEAKGGPVAKVAISYWAPSIVTAVETEKVALGFNTWSLDTSGNITKTYSTTGGEAFGVALCVFPTQPGQTLPFTLVENSSDDLSVAVWDYAPDEENIIYELASYNGTSYVAPQLAAASEGPGRPYFIVTAVRNTSSDLRMKVWQLYQPTPARE
jgi:hypothetical protein